MSDAELIALAPELAAAVLAKSQEHNDIGKCGGHDEYQCPLCDLADRLRMIGADE